MLGNSEFLFGKYSRLECEGEKGERSPQKCCVYGHLLAYLCDGMEFEALEKNGPKGICLQLANFCL